MKTPYGWWLCEVENDKPAHIFSSEDVDLGGYWNEPPPVSFREVV